MPGAQPQVYLNGDFIALDQAQISVMDRGFLFGDGVYEVIPCYNGRLFRLEQHLQRLENSLRAIGMHNPKSTADWRTILESLLAPAADGDQAVYLQVTRGAYSERNHAVPSTIEPTLFAMASPLPPADPQTARLGIAASTVEDIRWQRCDIKSIALLANVMLREEADHRGGKEAILIRDGLATEGATSNLFVVEGGIIVTPPKSNHLLSGISRDLVLELATDAGLAWCEAAISEARLIAAEEIWITSSTREVVAVTQLNGRAVGNGKPGPMFRQMAGLYAAYKARVSAGLAT